MARYAGIDPGLSTGGLVVVEDDAVVAAVSLSDGRRRPSVSLPAMGDAAFTVAVLRAAQQAQATTDALARCVRDIGPIDALAIEGFVDQPSGARRGHAPLLKERWKTPLVIGMLDRSLATIGFSVTAQNLVYTDAGVVLTHFRSELARLASRHGRGGRDQVVKGEERLRNDHLRKAWSHAAWLALRAHDLKETPTS